VSSVEWESTTSTSSQKASEARQSAIRPASLNAIMQAVIRVGVALMADYLLYATDRYALPILQPLADALQRRGHGVAALLVRGAVGSALAGAIRPVDVRQALALRPRAVFSAANDVPTF